MFWLIQMTFSFVYNSLLDFVFFVITDAFFKLILGDTRNQGKKQTIWLIESGVLMLMCCLIHAFYHTPYLLLSLTLITFTFTQVLSRINVQYWWLNIRTKWDEYQQHQDSMQMRKRQIEQDEKLLRFRQDPNTRFITLNSSGQFVEVKPTVAQTSDSRIWSRLPKMNLKLRNVFKKTEEAQKAKLSEENSFNMHGGYNLHRGNTKPVLQRHDTPTSTGSWYGNLRRRPLHTSMSSPISSTYSSATSSLKTKFMTTFFPSREKVPPGIRNEGQNLCFMNSILQCISRSPHLLEELSKEMCKDSECSVVESTLVSSLLEILQNCSKYSSGTSLDPTIFRQAASSFPRCVVAPLTESQRQQDSAEFFMWLMDAVHIILNKNRKGDPSSKKSNNEQLKMLKFIYGDLNPSKIQELKAVCQQEINKAHGLQNDSYAEPIQRLSDLEWLTYKKDNDSVIDHLFTGQLVIGYHCLTDNHISVNMQTFNILPVPIVQPRDVSGLVNLEDCFTKFCNVEHLIGQDGLECSVCNSRQNLETPFTTRVGNPRTPNFRQTTLSSTDSAMSGMQSPLSGNTFMSPIPGNGELINDSGFHDNLFKTSTPIAGNFPLPNLPKQRLRDAERRCLLRRLPDCLVIQLMRFSFNHVTRQSCKLQSPVRIPLSDLDLTQIMFDTITNREDLSSTEASYKYDLYGVCVHLGANSTNFGHYISYCLHTDGQWYKFDDETVTQVNMQFELTTRELRENAYILFYKKKC